MQAATRAGMSCVITYTPSTADQVSSSNHSMCSYPKQDICLQMLETDF